jgi:hypothetical protein
VEITELQTYVRFKTQIADCTFHMPDCTVGAAGECVFLNRAPVQFVFSEEPLGEKLVCENALSEILLSENVVIE